ncbi:MAG: hypothetical protein V1773_04285 [bacterium]
MKKFLLFIFLTGMVISGQQRKISDTITVVTSQKFKIPKSKDIVLTNIKRLNITAELLDANFSSVRKINECLQDPAPDKFQNALKGQRSVLVTYAVFETINDAGTYYAKINIDLTDEKGSAKAEVYYKIIVVHPILAAPMSLRDAYYFSEKETFSFATLEYTDFNSYSYQVVNEKTSALLDSGRGPIVTLDKIFNDINMVDNRIKIIGKYNGKEFQYKLKDGTVHPATWVTTLNKLSFSPFVFLKEEADFKVNKDPLVVSAYNDKILTLYYGYFSKTASGNFATAKPSIKNLSVTSEPVQYLKSAVAITPDGGAFSYIQITPNQDFLDGIEQCGSADIIIRVSFETQFKEKKSYTYYAQIIK